MFSTTRLRRLKTASWTTTLMTSMVQLRRMIMELATLPRAGSTAERAGCRSASTGAAETAAPRYATRAVSAQAALVQKLTSEDWNASAHRLRGMCFLAGTAVQLDDV